VLFIGNSLTAANDLPAMIEAVAAQAGVSVTTRTIAFPDFSLEDHWNDGRAVRAIREGNWTLIVLQQGPSSPPESQTRCASTRSGSRRTPGEGRAGCALQRLPKPFNAVRADVVQQRRVMLANGSAANQFRIVSEQPRDRFKIAANDRVHGRLERIVCIKRVSARQVDGRSLVGQHSPVFVVFDSQRLEQIRLSWNATRDGGVGWCGIRLRERANRGPARVVRDGASTAGSYC
jgi:hypothetical protein